MLRARDPAVAERIGDVLRAHGLRRMPSRIAVLAVLETYGHLSVAQIQRLLRETAPAGFGLPDLATIYRTVTTLVDMGILHTVAADGGVTKYGWIGTPHHHGVCTDCGAIIEISAQQMSSVLERATQGSTFILPEGTSLTLRGLCGLCETNRDIERRRVGNRSDDERRRR